MINNKGNNCAQSKAPFAKSVNQQLFLKDSFEDSHFYEKFLEENNLLQVQIENFEVMTDNRYFFSQYVSYNVRVITDHLSYNIKKRYRQFSDLYQEMIKFQQLQCKFPAKTHIHSKVSQQLSATRMKYLNNFLEEVLTLSKDFKIAIAQLLQFLQVKEQYRIHNLTHIVFDSITNTHIEESRFSLSFCLSHQMLKLNRRKQESLKYLSNIEKIILGGTKKTRIRIQELREVLVGSNQITGLIQCALTTNNQLVAISFLKTIHRLFSLEDCSYTQSFKRILEATPVRIFKIGNQHPIITNQDQHNPINQEFIREYFKLIDLYLKLKRTNIKLPINSIIKQILTDEGLRKLYLQWQDQKQIKKKKIRKRSTTQEIINFRISSIKTQSQNFVHRNSYLLYDDDVSQDFDFSQRNSKGSNFITLYEQSQCKFRVSKDYKAMHIHLDLNKSGREVLPLLQNWKYNKLVYGFFKVNINQDLWSLSLKVPNRQPKIFKLKRNYYSESQEKVVKFGETDNLIKNSAEVSPKRSTETIDSSRESLMSYKASFEPTKQQKENGFYYSLQIIEKEIDRSLVDIWYGFPRKQIQNYFQSQLSGKTNIIWKSILEIIKQCQQQQQYSAQLSCISEKSSQQFS